MGEVHYNLLYKKLFFKNIYLVVEPYEDVNLRRFELLSSRTVYEGLKLSYEMLTPTHR